jgi:hypothetical protein
MSVFCVPVLSKKAEKNLHKNYLGTIEGETVQLLCRSFIKKMSFTIIMGNFYPIAN